MGVLIKFVSVQIILSSRKGTLYNMKRYSGSIKQSLDLFDTRHAVYLRIGELHDVVDIEEGLFWFDSAQHYVHCQLKYG